MAEETFRLPKSSYDELIKIVQAYGNSGPSANLDEVAQTAAIDKTIVSRNNAFLMSVGIIEGGKAKGITERGRRLAHALHYNVAEDIASYWRDIISSSEFLQKMLTAVTIRGGMEDSALQSHIAYSAGETKGAHAMAGAGAIVEIFKVAGLVREQDGKLVAELSVIKSIAPSSMGATPKGSEKAVVSATTAPSSAPQLGSNLAISVQIQIQCTAGEVSELGPKLRKLFEELKENGKAEGQ